MKGTFFLACLTAAARAYDLDFSPPHPDYIFENPSTPVTTDGFRIPTSYESAVMGRRILALSKLGHLSTVFPHSSSSSGEQVEGSGDVSEEGWRQPEGLGGSPIGMMDYVGDCEEEGNPTILAITIATSFRNVRAGSNISVSMRWTPPYPPSKRISSEDSASTSSSMLDKLRRIFFGSPSDSDGDDDDEGDELPDTVPYSAANLPRFSLMGYLEKVDASEAEDKDFASCFVRKHPDAKYWLPGNPIHHSEWARMIVTSVYWVGGFGDRAYIGWLPIEEWNSVSREEWEAIQLPGEKEGWEEWSVHEAWAAADL